MFPETVLAASPGGGLPDFQAAFIFAILALLFPGFMIYGKTAGRVLGGEGKAPKAAFGFADLPVVLVLIFWFGLAAVRTLLAGEGGARPVTVRDLAYNALLSAFVVAAIACFLKARHIPLRASFGLGAVPPLRALARGAGLLAVAYPFVILATLAMYHWMGENARPQEILEFFREAVEESDLQRLAATALVGTVVAPVAEEFLFRGYIYGVLRRYLGPLAGMVICSGVFALIHGNLLALPALFVLALALTLAYERSGSLLVPIAMHFFFNALTLSMQFINSIRAL